MKNVKRIITLIMPLIMLVPGISSADVIKPALDIQDMGLDAGAILTPTTFDITATAFQIVTDTDPVDIADQVFRLTSTGTYDGDTGAFSGTFMVDGGLLSGTFSQLGVIGLDGGDAQFFADLTFISGSLKGDISGGRIEGILGGSDVVAKIGEITVVPVPAAAWLFGSGLIGLVGIARRKNA